MRDFSALKKALERCGARVHWDNKHKICFSPAVVGHEEHVSAVRFTYDGMIVMFLAAHPKPGEDMTAMAMERACREAQRIIDKVRGDGVSIGTLTEPSRAPAPVSKPTEGLDGVDWDDHDAAISNRFDDVRSKRLASLKRDNPT